MPVNVHHRRCEQIDRCRLSLLEMQFYRVERPAEIVPVGDADQPLIAINKRLATGCHIPFFRADLNVTLTQVESVVSLCAERPRDVGPLRKELTCVLPLRVNLQPVDRLKCRPDAETL